MAIRYGLAGLVLAYLVGVSPNGFLLIPFVLVAIILVVAFSPRRRLPRSAALVTFPVALGVMALLPVKALDAKVGPFEYGQMSLGELTNRLRNEQGVHVSAYPDIRQQVLGFSVPVRMTKRQVLEKLADDANCRLTIGYCGTGATVLRGAHPSFTYLEAWPDARDTPTSDTAKAGGG